MVNLPTAGYKYQGGSLAADDPTYVWRPADEKLFTQLQAGEFCYVFNSRQMGKSSLRVRTTNRLQQTGVRCATIDLAGTGSQTTVEQWYRGILFRMFRSFPDLNTSDWRTWWDENSFLPIVQRFDEAIAAILLKATDQPIVIFIDEIDSVLNLDFATDDFFTYLRTCYDQRATDADYRRLTFCLIGVTTPSYLIQQKGLNPINIGQAIELQGFTLENASPSLAPGLASQVNNPASVLAEILIWTGGQPFLTQKLCQLVIEHADDREANVERIVRQFILEDWESKDEPEHLRTIRDRILRNKVQAVHILERYLAILQQGELPASDTTEDIELQLSGLVKKQRQQLKVTNYIYARIFPENWVDAQLKSLWFLNQDWTESDTTRIIVPSKQYLYRVLAYNLALVGVCALSLFLAYNTFHSQAWEYQYGPYAGLIEFLRGVILIAFKGYLVFFIWRTSAVNLLRSKTPKAKRFRMLSLAIFTLVFVASLYHNLYAGPHALLAAHKAIGPIEALEFSLQEHNWDREYFWPSYFYTPYSLSLHFLVAVPFCLVSVFAATEDYSSSFDSTIDLIHRIDAIKKNRHVIARQITQISSLIYQSFNRYAIEFISLVTPYTTMFLGIEIIRTFEFSVGLQTLTEPGQDWLFITYSYSLVSALVILWMFTHYQRALSATYKTLSQLGYEHSKFLAENNIFKLLLKLASLNINLVFLAIIVVFNIIRALIAILR